MSSIPASPRHERAFRLLLRLLPSSVRDVHGEEMVEIFRWRLSRCRTPAGDSDRRRIVRLWWSTLVDLVATAAGERVEPLRRRDTGASRGTLADRDRDPKRLSPGMEKGVGADRRGQQLHHSFPGRRLVALDDSGRRSADVEHGQPRR